VKGWRGWTVLAVVAVGLLAYGVTRDTGPRSEADRVDAITKRVACPVCSGESVFESRNAAAVNIRNKVEDLVQAGRLTDDEIIASVQADSDAQLLLVPQRTGIEALAWILPVAAAAGAFAGLVLVFRSWRRAPSTGTTEADRALVESARQRQDLEP
jgi:cytochrome c-type biogenesis protein CcmH